MKRGQLLLVALGFEGALLVLALALGAAIGAPPFHDLQVSWRAVGQRTAAAAPLLLALSLATRIRWPPLMRLDREIREIVARVFARATMIDLLVISALAGLAEEALFRGVIQAGLVPVVGAAGAVLIAAALFGLAHFISTTYAVYAGVVGIYLGVLLPISGNLAVPILAHALYDFLALAYLTRGGSPGGDDGSREETTG